jgi:peptidoglycan/xylan/chitin deacetylase (PgdA/CDA1 family)
LTYHRVNASHPSDRLSVHPDEFVEQLDEVARSGRRVVTLEEGMSTLQTDGRGRAECVVITFDDGFEDNHSVALPILERFGFRATFFLATALIGSSSTLDRYRGCCDGDAMMDWSQARELRARGHTVGGHGRRHVELAPLPPDALREEVEGSARDIEREAGERPRVFCYPRGSENARVRRAVADAGYAAACTVRPGANEPGRDLLALRRTEIAGGDRAADVRLKLAGGFDAWHRLVQAVGRRRSS